MFENAVDVISAAREVGPKIRERNGDGYRLIGSVTIATGNGYVQYVLTWEREVVTDAPLTPPLSTTIRTLDQRTFTVPDSPCPSCGQFSVVGYLYVDESMEHMHTHYVCTFWPSGKRGKGEPYVATRPCGWHGWSVPE